MTALLGLLVAVVLLRFLFRMPFGGTRPGMVRITFRTPWRYRHPGLFRAGVAVLVLVVLPVLLLAHSCGWWGV
ncbi:hypothetical protein [Actinomadura oligospora]|uniref:hypothetical protein n=1 Tax=Actinomadura oligospora TaxID=111804 RepID=UPI0004790DA3|nr:hypothetical protein [Actinomadura oligospora]